MNRFSAGHLELTRCSFLGLFALVLASLSGCAPFATFPPDGTGPRVYPWMAPCPEVMATSLREAHNRVAPETPLVYNLPANTSKMAWDDVQSRLGPRARRMVDGDTLVWDLERFGIRNTKAFSDIGFWNNGKAMLVTISLERQNVMPFKFSHLQRFYIAMNSMPKSNYPANPNSVSQDAEVNGNPE